MTKTALQQELRNADITFRSKATKAELEQLLSKANGQTKPTTKKNKVGVKQVLREKFSRSGVVTTKQIDQIAAESNVTRATVLTAMSDLKNAKYAGKAGPLNNQKDGDSYRLAN